MAALKSISLADQVFEKLESDIISGVYPRGEVLTELKLVEQLNVSRTPIREALRRLEQERLIRDSGKGSVVLGITLEDLEDIMDIRLRCEGLAAFYAAKNRTEADVKRLRQLCDLQYFYFEKGDLDRMRELDDAFTRTSTRSAAAPSSWTPCVPSTGRPSATAGIPWPPGRKPASMSTGISAPLSVRETRNWRKRSWAGTLPTPKPP